MKFVSFILTLLIVAQFYLKGQIEFDIYTFLLVILAISFALYKPGSLKQTFTLLGNFFSTIKLGPNGVELILRERQNLLESNIESLEKQNQNLLQNNNNTLRTDKNFLTETKKLKDVLHSITRDSLTSKQRINETNKEIENKIQSLARHHGISDTALSLHEILDEMANRNVINLNLTFTIKQFQNQVNEIQYVQDSIVLKEFEYSISKLGIRILTLLYKID